MGVLDGLRGVQWGSWPGFKPFASTQCQWGVWQYVLVCSCVMGLQALCDFPLNLHRHTGLFLVAYYTCILLFCVPVVYVQLKIGAVMQRHIVDIYGNCIPALKGLPWSLLILSFLLCVYQNIYLAYSLQYAFLATKPSYPWGHKYNYTRNNLGGHLYLGQCRADIYFNKVFLDKTAPFGSPGEVRVSLVFTLALVWILLFLFTCRGPRVYGRLFPAVSCLGLICLLSTLFYTQAGVVDVSSALSNYVNNLHHTGAENSDGDTHSSVMGGLTASPLASPHTWIRALEQNIYNLALWCGVLPALGSYVGDRKHVNKITPVILLAAHAVLPLLLSLAVIPLVNGLAVVTDRPLPDIMKYAPTGDLLWFVVIPEALHQLNTSHFWAFMLFTTFFLLLLHQQTVLLLAVLENVRSACQKELVPIFRRQEAFTSAVCALGFLLGLPMVTQGGYYLLHTVQLFLYRGLFVLVILTAIPTAYVFVKLDPMYMPIERKFITGWFLAASAVMSVILLYNDTAVVGDVVSYKGFTLPYKTVGHMTAVLPVLLCLLTGLVWALVHTQDGTLIEKWQELITPSMAHIYPPVLNTEPLDLHFSQYNGTLKTSNRFTKKVKSSRSSDKSKSVTPSPTREESISAKEPEVPSSKEGLDDKSNGQIEQPVTDLVFKVQSRRSPVSSQPTTPSPMEKAPISPKEPEVPTSESVESDINDEPLEEMEESFTNLKPFKLESTVPVDDLCQTPIETEVCIEGMQHATPV